MAKKTSPTKPATKVAKVALLAGPTIELISPTGLSMQTSGDTVSVLVKVTPEAGTTVQVNADLTSSTVWTPPTTVNIGMNLPPIAVGSPYYLVSTTLATAGTSYVVRVTAVDSNGVSMPVDAYFFTTN